MLLNANWNELHDLTERIGRLSPAEQMYLIQQIAGGIQDKHFTDHAAIEKGLDEMAADPAIQEEIALWNGTEAHASG